VAVLGNDNALTQEKYSRHTESVTLGYAKTVPFEQGGAKTALPNAWAKDFAPLSPPKREGAIESAARIAKAGNVREAVLGEELLSLRFRTHVYKRKTRPAAINSRTELREILKRFAAKRASGMTQKNR
jgi:hypothetical protein